MDLTTKLEVRLARLLDRGTWIACMVIAAGLSARLLGYGALGDRVATIGVGLIIALPVLRVGTMLEYFHRRGEKRFGGLCALVLIIIVTSVILGIVTRN
jgi:uncharacterized membrane protein